MKKLFALILIVCLLASMSVTAFAEELTTNITLVLTDSYGDGWETATIKACLVKSDGSEELLREGMAVPYDSSSQENKEVTYEFTVDKFAVVRFYWVGTEEYDDECGVTIKRDDHIQYEQLGYEITDGALIFESEYNPRYTTVTYEVSPTYTVTIPETVTIGADGTEKTVSVEDVVVEKGQYVSVTLAADNDFTVNTAEGAELAYTVTANGANVAAGGEILAVNPKDGKNGTATVTFDIDETKIQYAGTYTGTATFTIAVKDVPMINFTLDTSYIGQYVSGLTTNQQAEAGMTWGEWVESEYNVDGYVVDESWLPGSIAVPGEYWAIADGGFLNFVEYTDEIIANHTYDFSITAG